MAAHFTAWRLSGQPAAWTSIAPHPGPVGVVSVIDHDGARTIYLSGGGIHRSIDNGASWVTANNGLPSLSVSDFAVDPNNPLTAYVGTFPGPVQKTTDGGETWSSVLDRAGVIHSLAVS